MSGLFDWFANSTPEYKSTSGGTFVNGSYQPSALDVAAQNAVSQGLDPNQAIAPYMSNITSPGVDSSSWLGSTKDLLGNKDFMTGAMGLGQLGLGLASYLQQKPLYKEQLKGLKQNRQFAAENQQNRKNIASDLG